MTDTTKGSIDNFVLTEPIKAELLTRAREALANAYCPYSNFPVGAAVLTSSGKIFNGSNVENASYGLTICAERAAIFGAVSSGELGISAIAVVTTTDTPSRPCGACRQVIAEFSPADSPTVIICVGTKGEPTVENIHDLLPHTFALI